MSTTIGKEVCGHCGQTINSRDINLFSGMVSALFEVLRWCEEYKTVHFTRKDIKHLLKNDGQIARFGDWVYFGGLVLKTSKGKYILDYRRTKEFFGEKLVIPIAISKSMKGDIQVLRTGKLHDVPNLSEFLDDNKMFIASYR